MARIATSIEESKRLLELGIDPKSADMYYQYAPNSEKLYIIPQIGSPSIVRLYGKECIPAWSLDGLLKLLPNDIAVSFQNGNDEGTLYWVDTFLATTFSDTYIGAMVEMIELLVEEGYIKVKEK